MDLLFDHKIRHSPVLTAKRLWRPPTDVFETEHRVMVLVDCGDEAERPERDHLR